MLQSHFLLVSFQFCWSNSYVCCWSPDFSLSTTSFHRLTHKLNPKHLIPSVKSHSFRGDIGDITIFVGLRWTRSLLRCAMTSRQWRPIWRTPNRKVTRLRLSVIDCFSLFFQHLSTIRGMICWDDSEMMSCFDEWRSPAFFWQLQVKTEQHHRKKHEENMTHPNISTRFELYTGKRKFVFSRKVKGWNFASFWNRYEQVERVNTSLSIVTYRNTGAKLLYRFWICWISSAKLRVHSGKSWRVVNYPAKWAIYMIIYIYIFMHIYIYTL